jgi:phosphatidate phosphatase PAH1
MKVLLAKKIQYKKEKFKIGCLKKIQYKKEKFKIGCLRTQSDFVESLIEFMKGLIARKLIF